MTMPTIARNSATACARRMRSASRARPRITVTSGASEPRTPTSERRPSRAAMMKRPLPATSSAPAAIEIGTMRRSKRTFFLHTTQAIAATGSETARHATTGQRPSRGDVGEHDRNEPERETRQHRERDTERRPADVCRHRLGGRSIAGCDRDGADGKHHASERDHRRAVSGREAPHGRHGGPDHGCERRDRVHGPGGKTRIEQRETGDPERTGQSPEAHRRPRRHGVAVAGNDREPDHQARRMRDDDHRNCRRAFGCEPTAEVGGAVRGGGREPEHDRQHRHSAFPGPGPVSGPPSCEA